MMNLLRKYKVELLIIVLTAALFFTSRIYHILSLPIFTDEAIYIRWAQIAKNDASWRFISLTDGKQPLFIWLMATVMKFVEDPLLAGRLTSVLAGLTTLLGLFFLGKELFRNRWIGIVSSILYVIFPMGIVYDKMALYDSLVGAFSVWGLLFTVLLIRSLRLDAALLLGMIIGGGVLNKSSGFFGVYLLPFSLVLFDWSKNKRGIRLAKFIGLLITVAILTYGIYSILRLSPFFHIIDEKNKIFVYPLKDWLTHPFTFFIGNWKAIWDWLVRYLTPSFLILAITSFFITKSFLREKLVLFIWFVVPALALALFGNTLYPRFILFMVLSLLPLVAFSIVSIYPKIKNKILLAIIFLVVLAFPLQLDYLIFNDFAYSSIPRSDKEQYNNDWPAGGGIKESVEFLKEQAQKGKIYIATQGTFGLLPYALEIYLIDNPNIQIEGYWPLGETMPKKVIDMSKKMPTYFIFYQPCEQCKTIGTAPQGWNSMELLYQYRKVNKNRYLSLYRVKS